MSTKPETAISQATSAEEAIEDAIADETALETAIDRALSVHPDPEGTPETDADPEATPVTAGSPISPSASFKRAWLRGYKKPVVDAWTSDAKSQIEHQTDTIASQLHEIRMLQNKLHAADSELRFWRDRESYIDLQLEAARNQADTIVADARASADNLTKRTQQNALQIIERAFREARQLLDEAKENADKTMTAANTKLSSAEDRMQNVLHARYEMMKTMRHTLGKLESELPKAATPEKAVLPGNAVAVQAKQGKGSLTLKGVYQNPTKPAPAPATMAPLRA